MKLTRIHQIEITSRCNLACSYCPHPVLKRAKMDMTMETFERALQWVSYFDTVGDNQKELAITGMGEALLHPEFDKMLTLARAIYPGFIHFSTNGILFDEYYAELCKDLNVYVFVSLHRPEVASKAVHLAQEYGVIADVNTSFAHSSLDFAGQVEWPNSATDQKNLICSYQKEGWGMVLADGTINTCCWEAEGENAIGHVNDNIGSVDMRVMPACEHCSLEILQ